LPEIQRNPYDYKFSLHTQTHTFMCLSFKFTKKKKKIKKKIKILRDFYRRIPVKFEFSLGANKQALESLSNNVTIQQHRTI
jgi:hypothetical protein